jgi:hypothetical protein
VRVHTTNHGGGISASAMVSHGGSPVTVAQRFKWIAFRFDISTIDGWCQVDLNGVMYGVDHLECFASASVSAVRLALSAACALALSSL